MARTFTELHLHLEGTFEPDLVAAIARRNGLRLPDDHPGLRRPANGYADLQAFLDAYYASCAVLRTAQDFEDLAAAYFARAAQAGVVRAELFFDPQTHTGSGVPLGAVLDGFGAAQEAAERDLGITSGLIACFRRDLGGEAASATLDALLTHRDRLLGVGLDSTEVGNPAAPFAPAFARAAEVGLRRTAHAGEEAGADFVRDALDLLGAERIDHGIRAIDDPALVERLANEGVVLTLCPVSNVRLRAVRSLAEHPLRRFLAAGVPVTLNSDDPAYFGGYLDDVIAATTAALGLTDEELDLLAATSHAAAFA